MGEGVCSPGDDENEACGFCGQRDRTCSEECNWAEWSECDDDGVCVVPLGRQADILTASLKKIDQEVETNAATEAGRLPVEGFGLTIEEIG